MAGISIVASSMASYQTSWYHTGEIIQGYYNNSTSKVYFGYFWFSNDDLTRLRNTLDSTVTIESIKLYFQRKNSSHGSSSSTPVQINTTTRRSASGTPSTSELGSSLIIGSFNRGEAKWCNLNETLLNHLLSGYNGFCVYHDSVKTNSEYSYYVRSDTLPILEVVYSPKNSDFNPNQSSVNFGSVLQTTITTNDSTYSHVIKYTFGEMSSSFSLEAGTLSHNFTVPYSWMNQIPNDVSGQMNIQITTYDSSGNSMGVIGRAVEVVVPSNIVPSAGTLSLSLSDGAWGYAVVNKTSITANLSGYMGTYGSTIKSMTISGAGFLSTTNSLTIVSVSETGTLTITATVVDSRGRSASVEQSIPVYEYALPYFESLEVGRSNSSGTLSSSGTYIRIKGVFICSSVNGNNSVTCSVSYVAKSTGLTTSAGYISSGVTKLIGNGTLSADEEYTVIFTLSDGLGAATYTRYVNSSDYAIHFKNGGRGVGIGQAATEDEAVRVHKDWSFFVGNNLDLANLTPASIGAAATNHYHDLSSSYITGKLPPAKLASTTAEATAIVNVLKTALLEAIYPIGSIYISVSSTNPSNFIGGTWERIQDKFLLAAGTNHPAAEEDGAESYSLSVSHNHLSPIGYSSKLMGLVAVNGYTSAGKGNLYRSITAENSGSDLSSNINMLKTKNATVSATIPTLPPYLAVYVWKRTA